MKSHLKKCTALILSIIFILTALPIIATAESFSLPEDITVGESLVDLNFTNGSVTAIPSGWTDERPGSSYAGWDVNKNATKALGASGLRLTSPSCDGAMFLPAYAMTDYVFEVKMTLNTAKGSMGIALNTDPDLSKATGSTKLMAYAKDQGADAVYLYHQNKYSVEGGEKNSNKLLREDYGIAPLAAGDSVTYKAYVIDGTCYFYLNGTPIVSFAVLNPLASSRPAIFTCGADVNVTSVKLNKIKGKNTEKESYDNLEFTEGKVIFETDFEGDEYEIGKLPEGWWAAYNGVDGLSYGFNHPTQQAYINAGISELSDYGKVFSIATNNADAFVAMPEMEVENYIYEADIISNNTSNYGIGNELHGGSPANSTGCAYFTVSSNPDEKPKYLKKPSGITEVKFDYPEGVSAPAQGVVNKLTILHLDGVNYIYLNKFFLASFSEAVSSDKAGLGFFTYAGNLNITAIKVTEIYAPEKPGDNINYIEGDVILDTDFEDDKYVSGELPDGWWAAYNGKDGLSYGWNHPSQAPSLTAAISELSGHGKVFTVKTSNVDAFIAMPDMTVENYVYEANIIANNTNNFGLGNELQGGSPANSTGCAYFTVSTSLSESPKYLKKPSGINTIKFDYPAGASAPVQGEVYNYKLIHINGVNHVFLNDVYAASYNEAISSDVTGLGFYTYGGSFDVTSIKVTEIFAPVVELDKVTIGTKGAVTLELSSLIKTKDIEAELEDAEFGFVINPLTKDNMYNTVSVTTKGAEIAVCDAANKSGDSVYANVSKVLTADKADSTLGVVPYVMIGEDYFYGSMQSICPASLADIEYQNFNKATKALVKEFFADSKVFRGENAKNLNFTAFSDFHYVQGIYPTSIADLNEIFSRAEEYGSSFVLSGGDFCNNFTGSPELVKAFLGYKKADGSTMPAYNNYGNHELETWPNSMQVVTPTLTNDANAVWGTADGKIGDGSIGYYYFDQDGFRFIVTDTNYSWNSTNQSWEHNTTGSYGPASGNIYVNSLGPVQLEWLEKVLYAAADENIPCVVVSHATLCPSWWPGSDAATTHKLFREVNVYHPGTVMMQISGHEHNDRQEVIDGVYYLGLNTTKNGLWRDKSPVHYDSTHTFQMETYDSEGNFTGYVTKSYGELGQGANTWFYESPLSTNITISQNGQIYVQGMETSWVYDVEPDPLYLQETDPWSHPYITESYNFTVFGDTDSNRTFDEADVTLVRKAIIGATEGNLACDVMKNESIDICDLVYLKKRLLGAL